MDDLIERLRACADSDMVPMEKVMHLLTEAADALEEMQVYAERYRWVRDHDNAFLLSEDVIDDQIAIDRARGEEEGK